MSTWHLSNYFHFFKKGEEDLAHLVYSMVARRVAITLIWIFSPVYIYNSAISFGYSQKLALVFAIFYFLLTFSTKLLTVSLAEDLSRKIGFKKTIKYSIFPFVLFVVALILSTNYQFLFFIASFLYGVHMGLFWWGYHGYFVKSEDNTSFGQAIGKVNVMDTFAGFLTPFLGAIVIKALGYNFLFVVCVIFMVLSAWLLGKDHDKRQINDITFTDIFIAIRKNKLMSISYIGASGESIIYAALWPIFLYLFFGKLISLGIVVSVAALISSVFSVAIGKFSDLKGVSKMLAIGSPALFISWMIKNIFQNFYSFVLGDSIRNFGQRMVGVPLNMLSYKKASEGKSAQAILFYETNSIIGVTLSLLVVLILILLDKNLSVIFIVASFFGALPLISLADRKIKS